MRRGLLVRPPTEGDLERLYHELARAGATSVGRRRPWPYRPERFEDLLALGGEMLRHDARLLSIIVQLVLARWQDIDPRVLRAKMTEMRWPQALAVVFEFVRIATSDPELRRLARYVCADWPRLDPPERFFVDLERPGSRTAERRLGRNLAPYARWGLIGVERPIVDPATKRTVGRYDAATRRRILDRLLVGRDTVTLAEYLDSVDHAVSRQQARADLLARGDLAPVARGRGSRWRVLPPRSRARGGISMTSRLFRSRIR